ncbi:hypothetical protein QTP70_027538 [Hemibagrus guttatus]|uniref:SGNH hydrolase-type esterase domain-containing protein n=1 Tax=Hemibagrus guttatus TaxID=175788 RepID=A0AAE0QC81_9TELE|nr:hypothetical protein QTP70_027538 [Hemibagrus guttatus]
MPEPPQLSPFDVEEQRLYSELLPGDRAPYPISKGAPHHPTEEAHFGRLYLGSYPFIHDPELMIIGEDSFELHSVDLELEAVEKQIRDLQVKQAQLRQRKAAFESSWTDAHLSQVPAILKKNIGAVVLHAGTNDIRLRQTEILKKDFRSLVELVHTTSPTTRIIVSGPLPTFQQGIERFYRPDGLHPSRVGAAVLSDNISITMHHLTALVEKDYTATGQAGASLHTMAVLQAYQADWLEELNCGEGFNPETVSELC